MNPDEAREVAVKPGDWALFRRDGSYDRFGVELKQVASVTPKLVKFGGGYPRQANRLGVVAAFANREDAEQAKQSIDGVRGEYERRRRIAEDQRASAITSALTAANKQIARILQENRDGE